MFGNVPRELPQRIALVLLQRFSFLPFSGLVESFRLANRMSGREIYRLTLTSLDAQTVTASSGVELNVGGDLTAAEARDTVVICSGLELQTINTSSLSGWQRKSDGRGDEIVSICPGRYRLACA